MFDPDPHTQHEARLKFISLVDSLLSTSFCREFEIKHDCAASAAHEINTFGEPTRTSDHHFEDREVQIFRSA